ncbi:endonuclease (plasmid) [Kitasatospora purpeofusca]|uniref:endonuclease n=1 Tax=Kitasatospora purpeofusca TaxID=67352 RepID=UPI002E138652|nr:endonuclease [Kitasatospora purpeofusca]
MSAAELSSRQRRRLRAALADRDGAACWYCHTGFGPGLDGATLDHLVPRSVVPTWALAALVLACAPCNEAKADTAPAHLLRPPAGRFGSGLTTPTTTLRDDR